MSEGKANKDLNSTSAVSRILADGRIVELVYRARDQKTSFAVSQGEQWAEEQAVELANGERLVPVSASNNLIRHNAILLPELPESFGSMEDLLTDLRSYLSRYVDLSETVQHIVSYYILLTWVYDAFN